VFSQPTAVVAGIPYVFGTAPRNAVIGPALQDFDLSLQKDFGITEGMKLQFRAEEYNLFNHPNFNIPNRIFNASTTSTFAQISSAQDSRQMQFALRLTF
jgi:hypothetical protein